MVSLWLDPPPRPATARLAPGSHHDVVVVGAGLTGLTTALLLAQAGRSVLVVESDDVGHGTTGHTTAKVSLLQGTSLSEIRSHASEAELGAYVAGNRAGQEWLLSFLGSAGATVERRDAWTYAVTPAGVEQLGPERDAARSAGLAVEESRETGLPFPVLGALRLPDQAQVHAGEALRALVEALSSAGATLVTGARVVGVDTGSPTTLRVRVDPRRTAGGSADAEAAAEGSAGGAAGGAGAEVRVTAGHVVLATGTPVLDRGLHFARLEPLRSYALALRVPGPVPEGMYLSADTETRSLRTVTVDGGSRLLAGGEGHVVGRGGSTRERVDRLLTWAQHHFPGAECTHQWSAQDYRSTRRLPLVGELTGSGGRVLVATGFNKWGMTNAVAAALSLAGSLTGDRPAWADELYGHALRPQDLAASAQLNASVTAHLARGWATAVTTPLPQQPPGEGQGVVGRRGATPVGVSTVDGRTCAVSAVCTHLGGVLSWNDAERSWDCPLHGSRFGPDGRRLEGPASEDLSTVDLPTAPAASDATQRSAGGRPAG